MGRPTYPHSNMRRGAQRGKRRLRSGWSRPREAPESYTTTTMRSILAAALLVLASCATTAATSRTASDEPRDGRALLARMHDRYAGRWFRTLTFIQRTVQRRPDGTEQVTTWYEAQSGPRLRIDVGDPALGNGVLYTADSLYVVRGGKVVRSAAEGNPFLPLVVSVYLEPLDVTVRQLAPYGIDLSRIRLQDWEGKPTYVVGARSASDTTSPQFWVEKDRLIVTRFLMALVPSPERRAGRAAREQRGARRRLARDAHPDPRQGGADADGGVHRLACRRVAARLVLPGGALDGGAALGGGAVAGARGRTDRREGH